jgi:hypothetical protein
LSAERAEVEAVLRLSLTSKKHPLKMTRIILCFCITQSTPTPTVFSSSGALAKAIDGKGWVLSLSLSPSLILFKVAYLYMWELGSE